MSFEDFQDGQHGGHLGYRNRTILAILTLHVATMPPTVWAQSDRVWEQMWFQDFQDGGPGSHLG